MSDKMVRFKRSQNGLYLFEPSYIRNNQLCATNIAIDSGEEIIKMFTNRQMQQATLARQVHHALSTPSIQDFKDIFIMNAVKDMPITIEDIKTAELIFGPDKAALKGKIVRKKPNPVVSIHIKIPRELISNHHEVKLCIDTRHFNGLAFSATISRRIMYQTVEYLTNHVLDDVFRIYSQVGFKVTTINYDIEYQPIMKNMVDVYGVRMHYSNSQEHVPEAERSIRVIKRDLERRTTAYH